MRVRVILPYQVKINQGDFTYNRLVHCFLHIYIPSFSEINDYILGIKKHEEKVRTLEKHLQEAETELEKSSTDNNTKDRIIERNKVK